MRLNVDELIKNALVSLNGFAPVENAGDYLEGIRDVLSALGLSPSERDGVIKRIKTAAGWDSKYV